MTKRQQGIYESWKKGKMVSLREAYTSFSEEKFNGYCKCWEKYLAEDGFRFRIISKNTWMFTVGYVFQNEKYEIYFHYFSSTRDEIFKICDNKENKPIWECC